MLKTLIVVLSFLFFLPSVVLAKYDPFTRPNNPYGIHIVDPNDLTDAAPLVNSSGGDWGYVTVVIPDNDRDIGKWQHVFDTMRRLHIIPIVRIATHSDSGHWTIPTKDDAAGWVTFLNKLNWPIENRYIILFNEPNHANEWGGTIDPEGYADVFMVFASQLRVASEDFFILPAGLDVSAQSDGKSLDAESFIQRMIGHNAAMLSAMDGWTSHSYPNPGFSAHPSKAGRGSLETFRWELTILASLGLTKRLPVFITETGWEHSSGKAEATGLLSTDTVSQYIQQAASSIWRDPQITAITPFVMNYQDYPFDHFSWKKYGSNEYYAMYSAYQGIKKAKGQPKQRQSYELLTTFIPERLVSSSTYTIRTTITNTGQGILEPGLYTIQFSNPSFETVFESLPPLEPSQNSEVVLHIKTPTQPGEYPYEINLSLPYDTVTLQKSNLTLIPPPTLTLTAQLAWKAINTASDVKILIYDNDILINKFIARTLKDGKVTVTNMRDIVPGKAYRVVLLVPGYLPRQVIGTFNSTDTKLSVKRLLPLDFDNDGAFSPKDIWKAASIPPYEVLHKFTGP